MIKLYAGIDVCKDFLDVFVTSENIHKRFTNNKEGHKSLNKFFCKLNPELVVIEATGSLHKAVWRAMYNNGLRVFIMNPRRSRQFAGSMGYLAKTDKVDAMVLAKYGELVNPSSTSIPSELEEFLQEILTARNQVTEEIRRAKNMLKAHKNKSVIGIFRKQLDFFEKQRKKLDERLLELVEKDETLSRKCEILTSIKGIGKLNALMLTAYLPELGKCNDKQISSLVGVVPFNSDSGNMRGKRMISGGRKCVRNMLYMGALSAKRYNKDMREFCERLLEKGKPAKVIIIAIIRKLVILANALIRQDRLWEENYV